MNGFLWSAGHLGWGLFALLVFSALWCLLADFIWRVASTRAVRFAAAMGGGWIVGAVLIALGFWLAR